MHRWVPWIAGFSADFVNDCMDKYLGSAESADAWVLDPFAGVGTTLVEAYLRGLNVVGFEINPYAAMAVKLKLQSLKISTHDLAREIARFERFMERAENGSKREPRSQPPSGFSGRTQLFSPKVERKVLFALDFISKVEEPAIKDIFRLGFGSVMVSFSNYSYEPSLTRRVAVDKPNIEDANVGLSLSAKLHLMLEDIGWIQGHMRSVGRKPRAKVFPKSIFSAPKVLGDAAVDLLITSPPYLNNYHYPRNTRPQLHWLGFTSGTGYNGANEDQSFGKFWQTVRVLPPVPLSFSCGELQDIVEEVRSRNTEKGPYGGPGWANYIATYFNDTYRFCSVIRSLSKPKGVAIIVLGNSIIQGVEVKTDYFFGTFSLLYE